MLDICFFAEKKTADGSDVNFRRWETVCSAFGIDHCYVIDAVGIDGFFERENNLGLVTPSTIISEFSEIPQTKTFVFVERDAPMNRTPVLHIDFDHPVDAVYCFGGDGCGMPYAWHEQDTELPGEWIYIDSIEALWAEHAAVVVFANRFNSIE